uniref:Inner membrane protein n=1 Tax=Ascaris lumbricoides TaxID=6252 RepID=A0A0M3HZY5_ASCLU
MGQIVWSFELWLMSGDIAFLRIVKSRTSHVLCLVQFLFESVLHRSMLAIVAGVIICLAGWSWSLKDPPTCGTV